MNGNSIFTFVSAGKGFVLCLDRPLLFQDLYFFYRKIKSGLWIRNHFPIWIRILKLNADTDRGNL